MTRHLSNSLQDVGDRRQHLADVLRVVKTEVMPRLSLLYTDSSGDFNSTRTISERSGRFSYMPNQSITCALAEALLDADLPRAFAYLTEFDQGCDEINCLDQLAATARYFHQLWLDDQCSFVGISLAMMHLQRMLNDTLTEFFPRTWTPWKAGNALLLALPDEQHLFGLNMLGYFFNRAGWRVDGPIVADIEEILQRAASCDIDLIAFTLSSYSRLRDLQHGITAVRRSSRNKSLIIFVGGIAFANRPEMANRIGADGTAVNADAAITFADRLLHVRQRAVTPEVMFGRA